MPDFLTVFPADDQLSRYVPDLIRRKRGQVVQVGQIEHAYELLQLPIRYNFVISGDYGKGWIGLAQYASEKLTPFVVIGDPNEITIQNAQILEVDFLNGNDPNFETMFFKLFFPIPSRKEVRY